MSFAGSKLNVQLTEGKALFHGGNMKVDVQSEFSARKRGGGGRGGDKERTSICRDLFLSLTMMVQFVPKNGCFVANKVGLFIILFLFFFISPPCAPSPVTQLVSFALYVQICGLAG